jgi:hypothetical protein
MFFQFCLLIFFTLLLFGTVEEKKTKKRYYNATETQLKRDLNAGKTRYKRT